MIKYKQDNIIYKKFQKINRRILVKRDQQPPREDLVLRTMFKVLIKLRPSSPRINGPGNLSIHNLIIKPLKVYFNIKIKLQKNLINKDRFKEIISQARENLRGNLAHLLFSHHRMANQICFKNRMFRIRIIFSLIQFSRILIFRSYILKNKLNYNKRIKLMSNN